MGGELLSLSEVPKTLNIRGPLWITEIILIKASIKILIFNEITSLSINQALPNSLNDFSDSSTFSSIDSDKYQSR